MKLILKDYLAKLLLPTPLIFFLLIIGVILLWRKKDRLGKWTVTASAVLMLLFSYDPLVESLLNSYENEYPGFSKSSAPAGITHVVVLGGGVVPTSHHALTTQLTTPTLTRVIEGIRIYRQLPGTKIIFTGRGWNQIPEAKMMKDLALELGVPEADIMTEVESKNTFDHTVYLKPLIGQEPFVLVTSALHMPRAIGLFKTAGYKPFPAPTQHLLTGDYALFNMSGPYPHGDNLMASDFWFMEFWGIRWASLKGEIK